MNDSYRDDTQERVGSLAPQKALGCPYCPRHFYTKSGRTRHIQAKHQAATDAAGHPSPVPTPSPQSFHNSLPPSPDPPSSHEGFNTNSLANLDFIPAPPSHEADPPNLNNIMPSPTHSHEGFRNTVDSPTTNNRFDMDISDSDAAPSPSPSLSHEGSNSPTEKIPRITRAFHRKLDGTSIFVVNYT